MIYGIYSVGGFARECLSLLQGQLAGDDNENEIVFIEDDPAKIGNTYAGCRVVSPTEFYDFKDKCANVAIAAPEIREEKVKILAEQNIGFFTIKSGNCHIGQGTDVLGGAILSAFTTLTCDLNIGKHFHCNIYSYVAHDCVIGDFVTLAPRVSLNGRITVGDRVYIGSDATVLPGKDGQQRIIGDGAVIGAGAVVVRDVEPGEVLVGNPARPLKR